MLVDLVDSTALARRAGLAATAAVYILRSTHDGMFPAHVGIVTARSLPAGWRVRPTARADRQSATYRI
jgi:hypothetical protein